MSAGLCLVAAFDRARAIGRDGQLPWHLPEDLKRFKALTLGHPVLMGYRTAVSIGRALPGRRNLVLSRAHDAPFPGQETVRDFAAVRRAEPDLCVAGGGEVFALALPYAQSLYLTEVDTRVEGADAYFPALPAHEWIETARSEHPADARHAYPYCFIDYRRRTP